MLITQATTYAYCTRWKTALTQPKNCESISVCSPVVSHSHHGEFMWCFQRGQMIQKNVILYLIPPPNFTRCWSFSLFISISFIGLSQFKLSCPDLRFLSVISTKQGQWKPVFCSTPDEWSICKSSTKPGFLHFHCICEMCLLSKSKEPVCGFSTSRAYIICFAGFMCFMRPSSVSFSWRQRLQRGG